MKEIDLYEEEQKIQSVFSHLLFVFSRFSASGQELLEEYADDADYLQLPVPEQYDPNILRNPEIKKTAFTLNTGMMLIAGKSKKRYCYQNR